jgi:hypothetical protein
MQFLKKLSRQAGVHNDFVEAKVHEAALDYIKLISS